MFGMNKPTDRGHGVYAVFDSAAGSFGNLMVFPSDGLAVRAMREAVQSKDSLINKNPTDFSLFVIGRYDQAQGELIPMKAPEKIIAAVQLMDTVASVVKE